jgi:flavin-dependent thymidylate synthase
MDSKTYTENFHSVPRKSVYDNKNLLFEIDNLLDGQAYVRVKAVYPSEIPDIKNSDKSYTSEFAAILGARTSFGTELKNVEADTKLLEYLTDNNHTSPLEFCSMIWEIKVPKAVAIQILRHRTSASMEADDIFDFIENNELSQRYTKVPEEYYVPTYNKGEGIRFSGTTNRQSSKTGSKEETSVVFKKMLEADKHLKALFEIYEDLVDNHNVGKEVARFYLPMGTYTTLNISFDLNNMMKFFTLRCASDAQYETRVIADAMFKLAKQFFPTVLGVWEKKQSQITLSPEELEGLVKSKCPDSITSKSGQEKFNSKLELYTQLMEKNIIKNFPLVKEEEIINEKRTNITPSSEIVKNISSSEEQKTINEKRTNITPSSEKAVSDVVKNTNEIVKNLQSFNEKDKNKLANKMFAVMQTLIKDQEEIIKHNEKISTSKEEEEEEEEESSHEDEGENDEDEDDEEEEEEEESSHEDEEEEEESHEDEEEGEEDEDEEEEFHEDDIDEEQEQELLQKELLKEEKRKEERKRKEDEERKIREEEEKKKKEEERKEEEKKKKEEERKRKEDEKKKEEQRKRKEEEEKNKEEERKRKEEEEEKKKEERKEEEEEEEEKINDANKKKKVRAIASPVKTTTRKIVSPVKKEPATIKITRASPSKSPTKVFTISNNDQEEVITLETRNSPKPSDKLASSNKKPIKVSAASPTKNVIISKRNPSLKDTNN